MVLHDTKSFVTASQSLLSFGKWFFASCKSVGERLTSVWLLSKFEWSKCSFLDVRFVIGFDEQFFRRVGLEDAFGFGVLQSFLLTVNTIVPMRYQLHLTCIKDEYLNM